MKVLFEKNVNNPFLLKANSNLSAVFFSWLTLQLLLLFIPHYAFGLLPGEVLVVANRSVPEGIELARYYMAQRNIPERNLILVDIKESESCSRDEYLKNIAVPLRDYFLNKPGNETRCLVLMYGLPIKVLPPSPSQADDLKLKLLTTQASELKEKTKALDENPSLKSEIKKKLANLQKEISFLQKKDQEASVDSEIALVRVPEHPLSGWLANPLYVVNKNKSLMVPADEVLFVSRLDGPSPETVKRIIDQSLDAEKKGLSGKVCLDARWHKNKKQDGNAYAVYDQALHRTGELLAKRNFSILLDDEPHLFQTGSKIPVSLYCGWYSLAQYVDAFSWQPGAIGYHIASSECSTLKKKNSQVWCKQMLEKGITATLGPVSEPYLQAFPLPEIFFDLLTRGDKTLVESYMFSLPYLSWKMILIGDPLYSPFSKHLQNN